MLFTEGLFFVFFAFVFGVHWTLTRESHRKIWLLAVSYGFYAAWDWRFLSLILLSTICDFIIGQHLAREKTQWRKLLLIASLAINLGMLAIFKYFNFFIDSLHVLFENAGISGSLPSLEIVLPVGISFYTFQTLSYTIDVYRKSLPATKSLLDFSLFVAFFPQLVAGPIVRASDFLPQLKVKKCWSLVDKRGLLVLFLSGFIKKACVSDNLAPYVDAFFLSPGDYDQSSALACVIAYGVQIYCDFSGYSEMAIACAGLLGYQLCNNFHFPYFSASVGDFWRRWHISLSTWLRDYLYIPLGGNRCSRTRASFNLMATMLLGGLWHGASWNFVLWGGLHGIALVAHREFSLFRTYITKLGWSVKTGFLLSFCLHSVGVVFTLAWVFLAWIPFRANDFGDTLTILRTLFYGTHLNAISIIEDRFSVLGLLLLTLAIWHLINYRFHDNQQWWRKIPQSAWAILYGFAWSLALAARSMEETPFIYFQF